MLFFAGQRWYNLSIENIEPPTSSDLYTCKALNEGGFSEANVTLVHSPNVATYVDDGDTVISWLLTGGVASGVLIFLILSLWLLFCSVQKARGRGRGLVNSSSKPSDVLTNSNGHLFSAAEDRETGDESKLASRTASIEPIEASTFEEQQLRQTTAVARAQRAAKTPKESLPVSKLPVPASASTQTEWDRPFPDLLDCHNQNEYLELSEEGGGRQQPPPPPFQPSMHTWNYRQQPSTNFVKGPRLIAPTASSYG